MKIITNNFLPSVFSPIFLKFVKVQIVWQVRANINSG